MSQIDVATKSPIRQRTQGLRSRVEVFVRNFEWTWTNAVLLALAVTAWIALCLGVQFLVTWMAGRRT